MRVRGKALPRRRRVRTMRVYPPSREAYRSGASSNSAVTSARS